MSLMRVVAAGVILVGLCCNSVLGGAQIESQLSEADKLKASALIEKVLRQRGFDDDAIAAIAGSWEGYEPTFGFNAATSFKSRWFGFDPETGELYPSDVRGFAESLNSCYSKLTPNKYSRERNKVWTNDDGSPQASDETFAYCNYRFDPATGCRLSEMEGFRCRYFFHNEGGLGTCDNWGAGPLLAFDPDTQGHAKLQLEAPKRQDTVVAELRNQTKTKQTKTKTAKVSMCNFHIDEEEEYQKYLDQAKANGYPN
ncbi:hypothetical protein J3P71_09535 [Rhizobium leguminosarum]|uniref:hypothetical protein n=1 Tax=Rhizobium leguminosarum TaxID=384 RepID=UPI0014415E5F|nr:hypothetical protein [Rhizobium leguminosarum]MBY5837122.1 hypothetical protein [Rhizobium leguminosarum]NKM77666.1 hypothetical protein [Rhizobium leguminosarum bv. viciae]QSZ09971.1 hypothetical protein J3P71_09535 [Rhizobium leguminosarum]